MILGISGVHGLDALFDHRLPPCPGHSHPRRPKSVRIFRASMSSAGELPGTNYKVLRAWYSDANETAGALTVVPNRIAAGGMPSSTAGLLTGGRGTVIPKGEGGGASAYRCWPHPPSFDWVSCSRPGEAQGPSKVVRHRPCWGLWAYAGGSCLLFVAARRLGRHTG